MQAEGNDVWPIWEPLFARFLNQDGGKDVAHDQAHIQRVVANSRKLADEENAQLAVVIPAAWLHDCITMQKDSPHRSMASRMAASKAGDFLHESGYPAQYIPAIQHAISAHSFSAQIPPETLEAKIVQDADRLDAVGAIGIARCFTIGGILGTRLYDPFEPFPDARSVNDRENTVDHFYAKLLKLAATMQTAAGKREAVRRTKFMQQFLDQLRKEIQAHE